MRYVGLALYAEGPSDYYFLRPLLLRLCEQICARRGIGPIDFSDVWSLDHGASEQTQPRHRRIVAAAADAEGLWQLLFVHSDGDRDPEGAWRDCVEPAIDAVAAEFGERGLGIGVVPIREMESWALMDGDALRDVLGVGSTDDELGLPSSGVVAEAIPDPKETLRRIFQSARSLRRRHRDDYKSILNALGERTSLDRLRTLSSFRRLENDLSIAFQRLRLIR